MLQLLLAIDEGEVCQHNKAATAYQRVVDAHLLSRLFEPSSVCQSDYEYYLSSTNKQLASKSPPGVAPPMLKAALAENPAGMGGSLGADDSCKTCVSATFLCTYSSCFSQDGLHVGTDVIWKSQRTATTASLSSSPGTGMTT